MSSSPTKVSSSSDDSKVLLELMSPDGYYRYLGVTKPSTETAMLRPEADSTNSSSSKTSSSSDGKKDSKSSTTANASKNSTVSQEYIDQVKKSYRKLSLKHHPDKSGGNVDTFRLLNRAQRVLLDTKLRAQYDLLGIDLDDDDDVVENDTTESDASKHNHSNDDDKGRSSSSSPQGILQEIANNVLAGVLQLGVRTSTFCCTIRLHSIVEIYISVPWIVPNFLFCLQCSCSQLLNSANGNCFNCCCTILVLCLSSVFIFILHDLSNAIEATNPTRYGCGTSLDL
jgi:DnaJ domain